jgi:pyrroline-5-carboxylate reductase
MNPEELAPLLVGLGCPEAKAVEMAAQLLKRAGQLVQERGWTPEQALRHLLTLLQGGWAAQARGLSPQPPTPPPPNASTP